MAASFPSQVTASAVWLTEMGLDVALIEFNAYRTGQDIVLAVTQTWPVPEVEDFTISPRRMEQREADERQQTRRETRSVARLVDAGAIEDGALIELRLDAVPSRYRDSVAAWVGEDRRRAQARWRNDRYAPLTWEVDGGHRTPTTLAKEIVEQATGTRPGNAAPWWWQTDDGVHLGRLASQVTRRDWSDLHQLLDSLKPGEWTTYGDLAETIGSVARAVGQHITRQRVASAHRVLRVDGQVADNFSWSDPDDTRDPKEMLREEGTLLDDDRADPARRLDADALRERL